LSDGGFGPGGNDFHSLSGNPLLADPSAVIDTTFEVDWTIDQKLEYIRNQVREKFMLRNDSKAIDKGIVIPGYHCPTSGAHPGENCHEWYGSAPDIGAYEYRPALTGECAQDSDCSYRGPGFICNNSICEWHPPIGITKPEFGIEETYRMYDNVENRNPVLNYTQNAEGGFYTHYVNNSGSCTDDNGNNGTVGNPRCTIPSAIPEGSVVEVHGENYGNNDQSNSLLIKGNGTKQRPVFIRGVSSLEKPEFTGLLAPRGNYMIVENLYFYHTSLFFIIQDNLPGPIDHVALRGCEFVQEGVWTKRDAIGIHTYTSDVPHHIVIYNNHIHHYGD
jgi:hypothetical protein